MSDPIDRPPLPPAAGIYARPRNAREAAAHGGPDEPSPQAVAMAVVLGPAAVPNSPAATAAAAAAAAQQGAAAATRGRHASVVARGASAAGQALAALARSVRTSLVLEDSGCDGACDAGDAGGVASSVGHFAGDAPAALPAWLLEGRCGGEAEPVLPGVRAAGPARSAQPQPRARSASADPIRLPALSSTEAIVRVRAPQRVQRHAPPRYWTMLRIVSWGTALAGAITLASAYWLIATYPHDDTERAQEDPAHRPREDS